MVLSGASVPLPQARRGAMFASHEKNSVSGKHSERVPCIHGLFAGGGRNPAAPQIRTGGLREVLPDRLERPTSLLSFAGNWFGRIKWSAELR
jgi:hypothetical protein